jgi:hypothetical protein
MTVASAHTAPPGLCLLFHRLLQTARLLSRVLAADSLGLQPSLFGFAPGLGLQAIDLLLILAAGGDPLARPYLPQLHMIMTDGDVPACAGTSSGELGQGEQSAGYGALLLEAEDGGGVDVVQEPVEQLADVVGRCPGIPR